jgi:2-phosphosulfolactate phosphatase
MNINILQMIQGAREATGITVIIDVFRAFTVEAYLINNGVKKLIPVGDKKLAYDYKKEHDDCILIGERRGIMLEGFDYGNSPSQIENIDFSGKTVIHTTSSGTQGISNAKNAKEILTGSLVNAKAIAEYIKRKDVEEVSLVAMGNGGETEADEDTLCAKYIKSLLEGNEMRLDDKIENLKLVAGKRFFNKDLQEIFPKRDFYLSTEVNKFNFVLKVEKDSKGMNYIKKIDIK